MRNKFTYIMIFCCIASIITSCESEVERIQRETKEENKRIELEIKQNKEAEELAFQQEQKKIEQERLEEDLRLENEARLEQERKEKAKYDKYINNSLNNGATPYLYCYGGNQSCSSNACSEIKVTTPFNSDVIVTIKKQDKVIRHAYIKAGRSYSFEFPDGTYQPYFYYGNGWDPNKEMTKTNCGTLKGGFIANEHFGKDEPQMLSGNILEYELILQQNGNFSTSPSNSDEAF